MVSSQYRWSLWPLGSSLSPRIFDKASALFSLFFVRVRVPLAHACLVLARFFSNGTRLSPTDSSSRLAFRNRCRAHPPLPSPQRSAPYTPILLARAPGRYPLLALIHLYLLHFSPRYILFCVVWDSPACRPSPHGADQTTSGRGAVGTFRYT